MNKKIAARHGFKLQKLERPIMVRNVDRTNNSGEAITYQVEVNVYYKGHVERMRMDVCYKKAKLQAGIKPTVLCLAIDKENSIEFLLDLLYYIYNYYYGYAPCLL